MTMLYRIAAEGQTRLHVLRERPRDDRGQGTLEYVGIAVLIGVIMVALFKLKMGEKVSKAVEDAFKKISEPGS
ncbi:hypothetical protein [Angustibacter aerolatus]